MATTALTVERPSLSSLAIPGALFSPCELAIGPSTSAEEYSRIGKAISAISDADKLWECDYALWGMKKFGTDEGLVLAASATGLGKFFLKRCARIAERFDPSRRFPHLNRNHYRSLLPFKQSDIDQWLPSVAAQKRLSAKSLRALAVEQFGEPVEAKQPQKHVVQIRETTWTRLTRHAPSRKAVILIELILDDWLKRPQSEQAIVLAAEELRKEQKRERQQARQKRTRKRAVSGAKEPEEKGTASLDYQLAKFKREHSEWSGLGSLGNTEAKGTNPVAVKRQRKAGKVGKTPNIVWTVCQGPTTHKSVRGDSFPDRESAQTAAAAYKAARGWTPFISFCEQCSAFHLYRDSHKKSQSE
jgi:hypothetical protein